MRKWLLVLASLALPTLAQAQISINYTFTAGTVIDPDQMNTNFSTIGTNALNRTGGTVTGAIASSGGSLTGTWTGGPTFSGALVFSGSFTVTGSATFDSDALHIFDTNASHDLIITPGSDLSADRVLTLTTGDSARTVTISGDATISQDYSSSGSPTFAGLTVSGATVSLRGVSYTWPAAAASGVLVSNGSGVLSWGSVTNVLLDGANHTDTLAASVTRGDIIVGNSTPKWSELAIGTASKVLRSDGTDVGWAWPVVSSQSGTFSATDSADYYIVSATATANLPACNSGRSGKWFHFKNTAASGTVTLDGNSSETIDGATTYAFSQQYASISIVCDGGGAWSIF